MTKYREILRLASLGISQPEHRRQLRCLEKNGESSA